MRLTIELPAPLSQVANVLRAVAWVYPTATMNGHTITIPDDAIPRLLPDEDDYPATQETP